MTALPPIHRSLAVVRAEWLRRSLMSAATSRLELVRAYDW